MRIVFLAKAGKPDLFKPVVQNQYDALASFQDEHDLFPLPIVGSGYLAYLKSIPYLFQKLRKIKPDLIHAHYSFSGIMAALVANKIPVVTSLMGSDIEAKNYWLMVIRFYSKRIWKATIVKSDSLKTKLDLNKLEVLPNGVDLARFYPMDIQMCKEKLNWHTIKKQVLFLADPARKEKNITLIEKACQILNREDIELKVVNNIAPADVSTFLNAADVVLLSSLWEGSPNIIKEAMACNRPIVSTPVGDVKELFDGVSGVFISSYDPTAYAEEILRALDFKESHGRERIQQLGLDSNSVSQKLLSIYLKYGK
jgi:glycosyltransferase involved in cell wall biosynthesis